MIYTWTEHCRQTQSRSMWAGRVSIRRNIHSTRTIVRCDGSAFGYGSAHYWAWSLLRTCLVDVGHVSGAGPSLVQEDTLRQRISRSMGGRRAVDLRSGPRCEPRRSDLGSVRVRYDPSPRVRRDCVLCPERGWRGGSSSRSSFVRALTETSFAVRCQAARSLGLVAGCDDGAKKTAVPALVLALKEGRWMSDSLLVSPWPGRVRVSRPSPS